MQCVKTDGFCSSFCADSSGSKICSGCSHPKGSHLSPEQVEKQKEAEERKAIREAEAAAEERRLNHGLEMEKQKTEQMNISQGGFIKKIGSNSTLPSLSSKSSQKSSKKSSAQLAINSAKASSSEIVPSLPSISLDPITKVPMYLGGKVSVHQQEAIASRQTGILGKVYGKDQIKYEKYSRKLSRILCSTKLSLNFGEHDFIVRSENIYDKATFSLVEVCWDWKRDYFHWKSAVLKHRSRADDIIYNEAIIAEYASMRGKDSDYPSSEDSSISKGKHKQLVAIA